MKQIFLVVLLMVISLTSEAINHFPTNSIEFLQELKTYMHKAGKTSEESFNSFEKLIQTNKVDEVELKEIIATCNLMLDYKLSATPYFNNYLNNLRQLKNSKYANSFKSWNSVVRSVLKDKKELKAFGDFVKVFMEKGYINTAGKGINWKLEENDFEFVVEGGAAGIKFQKSNLICERNEGEELVIYNTEGIYLPSTKTWLGEGGKITWERHEMKEVYCELQGYEIGLKESHIKINGAKLHYPKYFNSTTIEGRVEDKLNTGNKVTFLSYPKFHSKEDQLFIQDIGGGVQFKGAFILEGKKSYGAGGKSKNALVRSYDGAQLKWQASCAKFTFSENEKVKGKKVTSTLYVGQDSIFHPAATLDFDINANILSLAKGKKDAGKTPFTSSYHGLTIDCDKLDWKLNEDEIYINNREGQLISSVAKRVRFESTSFYNVQDYRKVQSLSSVNPIAILKVMSEKGEREVKADHFAKMMNRDFDISSVKRLILHLQEKGFVVYNKPKETILILEKTIHYADAEQGKVDYDVIKFISDTEKNNAVYDLKDHSLTVNHVNNLEFSAKQKVAAKPIGDSIVIQENRAIGFDGNLYAGFGYFEGKDYTFNYEEFSVQMDSIRFFDLYVPEGKPDANGDQAAYNIDSRLEHLSGKLYIDQDNNKSGKESIEHYPYFESEGNAYIFYDDSTTVEGVYDRERFYYEVDPFKLNSLDQYSNDDLKFKGKMVSADIFPDFKEKALVQTTDQSLGFIHQTPTEGYGLYKNKGNYKGIINLDNTGLKGKGRINYQFVSFNSDDIVFKPEQLISTAELFELKEVREANKEIPEVVGNNVDIDWRPYSDSMYITSFDSPFELFKDPGYTLGNTLIMTPGGLKGRGQFNWEKGTMNAELYSIGANSIQSDTASLQIRAHGVDDLAINTENVYTYLDFDKQIGKVRANIDESETTLPYNQFRTNMNEFDWDMKNETLTFLAPDNGIGSFTALHEEMDELEFNCTSALYDLRSNDLQAGGVEVIEVGDALINPDGGKVDILHGGKIKNLENARIVANKENKYHVFNKANIEILGKLEYKASGFYEYHIGDKKQEIEFKEINGILTGKGKKKNKVAITKGSGSIKIGDELYIDKFTKFHGDITMDATQPNLYFQGFAKIDLPTLPKQNWFSIKSSGDKNNLCISYDEPKNLSGSKIFTGIYIDRINLSTYPAVMMPKHSIRDRAIFQTKGVFKLDEKGNQFVFGDSIRVVVGAKQGNILHYDNESSVLQGKGSLSLCDQLDYINLKTAGEVSVGFTEENKELRLRLMAGLEMNIPEKVLQLILLDLQATGFNANDIIYKRNDIHAGVIGEFVSDSKQLATAVAEVKNGRLILPEKENIFNLLFSDLTMDWKSEYGSFISSGDEIGLATVNGQHVQKMLEGIVEFKMPASGNDGVQLYIKSPSDYYYYFGYKEGILSIGSNNLKVLDAVDGMKERHRVKKMNDGETFEIMSVGDSVAARFKSRAARMKEHKE